MENVETHLDIVFLRTPECSSAPVCEIAAHVHTEAQTDPRAHTHTHTRIYKYIKNPHWESAKQLTET